MNLVANLGGAELQLVKGSDGHGDLLIFKGAVLARAEVNSNNDDIDARGIEELAASIAGRPIDLEHEAEAIVGMFTGGDGAGGILRTDGIIWADRFPEHAEQVMGKKYGLSIEAMADRATCSKCGKEFLSASQYCDHLKKRRSSGARRRLHGLKSKGGALTKRPAGSGTGFDKSQVLVMASHGENALYGAHWYEEHLKNGETINDLPASDFADPEGRRFPYKIHGKVFPEGWKAAWSAAHGGHTGRADESAIEKLRRDKPEGVTIKETDMSDEDIQKLQEEAVALQASLDEVTKERDELKAAARRSQLGPAVTDAEWNARKAELLALSQDLFNLMAAKMAPAGGPPRTQTVALPQDSGGDRLVL